jgi:hypothetical protein
MMIRTRTLKKTFLSIISNHQLSYHFYFFKSYVFYYVTYKHTHTKWFLEFKNNLCINILFYLVPDDMYFVSGEYAKVYICIFWHIL